MIGERESKFIIQAIKYMHIGSYCENIANNMKKTQQETYSILNPSAVTRMFSLVFSLV